MISDDLHIPKRGDAVEVWLREHDAEAELLEDYQRHADTRTPIDQEVTEDRRSVHVVER